MGRALDLTDKIVFITGASSGIGKASAYYFAEQGCKLILSARRAERLQELAADITAKHNVAVHVLQLDVQQAEKVANTIADLPAEWATIDVLVNNAGLAVSSAKIQDADPANWDTMIDTNVKGLLYVTRAVIEGMVERNSGHIINIGSVAGHEYYPGGNIYCATKHAVKAICRTLRLDLLGTAIRVSEVAPGAVHTEFSEVRWQDKAKSDAFYDNFTPLQAEDIADAIVYCATRPLHVDVSSITVYPTVQASCNHLAGKDAGAILK